MRKIISALLVLVLLLCNISAFSSCEKGKENENNENVENDENTENTAMSEQMRSAEALYENGDKYSAARAYAAMADSSHEAWQRSMDIWGEITERKTLSAGWGYTVAINKSGSVLATEFDASDQYYYGQDQVSSWTNIIAVSCGWDHTVGLKADGTVVAVGSNEDGQCNVSEWRNIVAVYAGYNYTLGLTMNGTVVFTDDHIYFAPLGTVRIGGYYSTATLDKYGVVDFGYGCSQSEIVDFAYNDFFAGVKSDGTVVLDNIPDDYYNDDNPWNKILPDVSSWNDIVDIEQSSSIIVGLKADGTLVGAAKTTLYYEVEEIEDALRKIASWRNVISISVEGTRVIALTAGGKVLTTGDGAEGRWYDIKVPQK